MNHVPGYFCICKDGAVRIGPNGHARTNKPGCHYGAFVAATFYEAAQRGHPSPEDHINIVFDDWDLYRHQIEIPDGADRELRFGIQ